MVGNSVQPFALPDQKASTELANFRIGESHCERVSKIYKKVEELYEDPSCYQFET